MTISKARWLHVLAGLTALTAAALVTAPWPAAGQAAQPPGEPPRPRAMPEGVQVQRDVEYGKVGDRPLVLDLYRPAAASDKPVPAIVYIHGGAWRAGNKAAMPPLGLRFVRQGYVCASIGYRLSQEAVFPAQIEDCKAALRFLRAHAKEYGIDPDRIGCWGQSAGGHLVALLGTSGDVKGLEGAGGSPDQSSRVQAVVDCFGPTDFLQMGNEGTIRHLAADSPESLLIGGPVLENKDKVARANPITYVSKDDPPFLILHGDQDRTVPMNQSELLHEALKKAGVDTTLHVVKGAGHGFRGPEVDDLIRAFFDKHLKGAPAAPEAK